MEEAAQADAEAAEEEEAERLAAEEEEAEEEAAAAAAEAAAVAAAAVVASTRASLAISAIGASAAEVEQRISDKAANVGSPRADAADGAVRSSSSSLAALKAVEVASAPEPEPEPDPEPELALDRWEKKECDCIGVNLGAPCSFQGGSFEEVQLHEQHCLKAQQVMSPVLRLRYLDPPELICNIITTAVPPPPLLCSFRLRLYIPVDYFDRSSSLAHHAMLLLVVPEIARVRTGSAAGGGADT